MRSSRRSTDPPAAGTAFDAALRILAARPHAAAELRLKLRGRRHDAAEVEAALTRLKELGYLDDAAFARSLVGWRSRGRGRRALAGELAARGVDREAAAAALAELDPAAEAGSAEAIAAAVLRSGGLEALPRAAAKLRRRGFSEVVIRSALRTAAAAAGGDVELVFE